VGKQVLFDEAKNPDRIHETEDQGNDEKRQHPNDPAPQLPQMLGKRLHLLIIHPFTPLTLTFSSYLSSGIAS
jgi:hypothetical protein